jgi:hypothetical protein
LKFTTREIRPEYIKAAILVESDLQVISGRGGVVSSGFGREGREGTERQNEMSEHEGKNAAACCRQ